MADEKPTAASLSEIMERYNLPGQKLDSLIAYLQRRLLDFKEHQAFAILQAIQNSGNRGNLTLQDFGHGLHRQSVHAQQGDNSLEAPTLPMEIGDMALPIDISADALDADQVIMLMMIEWVQQETGRSLSMKDGVSVTVIKEPTPLQIKDIHPPAEGNPELNEASLLELSKVSPDLAARLTSEEIYTCSDEQQAISKNIILALVDAKTDANARRIFRDLLPDLVGFGRENLKESDFDRADGRMTFCTIAQAVAACLVLEENGVLQTGMSPERKRDPNSEALNEQLKQELQALNQDIANFLLEQPYTLKKSGLLVVSKRLVCQLFDAQDAQEASTRLKYFFPDVINYTRSDLKNNDDVDGHMKFNTLADTFQIVSWILSEGRLRADYTTPFPPKRKTDTPDTPPSNVDFTPQLGDDPAQSKPSDVPEAAASSTPEDAPVDEGVGQDGPDNPIEEVPPAEPEIHESSNDVPPNPEDTTASNEPEAIQGVVPLNTDIQPESTDAPSPIPQPVQRPQNLNVRTPIPAQQPGKVIFSNEKPAQLNGDHSELIRDEIVTLMTTTECTFGANNKRVKEALFPHVVRTGDNRFFVRVSDIHSDILGGYLTEIFDASFGIHLISSEMVGPAAFNKPGKYMELKHALLYIHEGAKRSDVRLKIDN